MMQSRVNSIKKNRISVALQLTSISMAAGVLISNVGEIASSSFLR